MRRSAPSLHAIGCHCAGCTPRPVNPRTAKAIKRAGRILFVAAAVILIPFIMVISVSHAKGERR